MARARVQLEPDCRRRCTRSSCRWPPTSPTRRSTSRANRARAGGAGGARIRAEAARRREQQVRGGHVDQLPRVQSAARPGDRAEQRAAGDPQLPQSRSSSSSACSRPRWQNLSITIVSSSDSAVSDGTHRTVMKRALIGLLIVLGHRRRRRRVLHPPRRTGACSVNTSPITRGDIVDTVGATGTLQAVTTVQVGSQVSGNISWLGADFNSIVKKGQVIARLDPSLFEAQLEQATANLQQARANLTKAQSDLERSKVQLTDAQQKYTRAKELAAQSLLPQSDLDAAKIAVDSAQATLCVRSRRRCRSPRPRSTSRRRRSTRTRSTSTTPSSRRPSTASSSSAASTSARRWPPACRRRRSSSSRPT